MVGAEQKLEHGVGLEVVVRVPGVLVEGETWLSWRGGIGGLSGSDIVLSGPTEGEDWDKQYQQVATHNHWSPHEQELLMLIISAENQVSYTMSIYKHYQGDFVNLHSNKENAI